MLKMDGSSFSSPTIGSNRVDFTSSASKRSARVTGGGGYGSYDPYHSTPKSSSSGATHMPSFSTSSLPVANHSSHGYANRSPPTSSTGLKGGSPGFLIGRTSPSPNRGRAGSPTRGYASSPPRHSYISELETTTIQKQRKELHLLIGELQDRDRELNEMVSSHQKQLLAWEQDRQKLLTLEQRYSRLEGELQTKNEQVRSQSTQLKVLESQDQSKQLALQSTQKQLEQMSEKASSVTRHAQELEEHNAQLNAIIRDLSNKAGNLEAREQELATMLKLKDNDLSEASAHITDISSKLKRLNHTNMEVRHTDATTRKELANLKQKHNEVKEELEKLTGQLNEQNNTNTEQSIELGQTQGQMQALEQELALACEREKRKDQLLELQRSKQERTDSELTNLRQVYERQHRDLSLLQLNLDSKNEAILMSQLSNSLHDDQSDRQLSKSRKSQVSDESPKTSPLRNGSPRLGSGLLLTEDPGELREGPEISSGDTEELLTADSSGEQQEPDTSPTSKLHRLLTESRQMVQNLEQTTLPPYLSLQGKKEEVVMSPQSDDEQ